MQTLNEKISQINSVETLNFDLETRQVKPGGSFNRGQNKRKPPRQKPKSLENQMKELGKTTQPQQQGKAPKKEPEEPKDSKNASPEKKPKENSERSKNEVKDTPPEVPVAVMPDGREDTNGVYFHPGIVGVIRRELTERGIETKPLKEQNGLPYIPLLERPVASFSMAVGKECTFIVTGYYNNGRTERAALSLVSAPHIKSEVKKTECNVEKAFAYIQEKYKAKSPDFSFSVILSADKDAESDTTAKTIPLTEPFSVDGIFGCTFTVDEKPKLFLKKSPPLTVRNNYGLYKELRDGEMTQENVAAYFRKVTKDMSAYNREVFVKEMRAFASMEPNLETVTRVLGLLGEYIEH